MQRRRARSNGEGVGTEERPRFQRFAAAMAHARATGAPELALYDGQPTPYDGQPVAPYQPATYDDQPATYDDQPDAHDDQFTHHDDRFAAYDDQPAAYDDRFSDYDDQPAPFSSPVVRPALRPVAPRSRRARGRAVLRWLGIGSCVLLVCVLIAGWLAWPESARLVGRWLAAEQSDGTARAQTVIPAPPPAPTAAADR
jgi:hypothetical protein